MNTLHPWYMYSVLQGSIVKPCLDRRLSMIESLLAPYENRSWAHTNWILVRLWKVSWDVVLFSLYSPGCRGMLPTVNNEMIVWLSCSRIDTQTQSCSDFIARDVLFFWVHVNCVKLLFDQGCGFVSACELYKVTFLPGLWVCKCMWTIIF